MNELYKKHRPKKFSRIIGQEHAVSLLEMAFNQDNVPHAILFTGQSGCGKTTLARIVRRKLKCSKVDFVEDAPRKVEDVRQIRRRIGQAPMKGKCRVWLIDECHKLTSDAQDEFLKMLEDTPAHVYFLLTTTDPQKLKKTIRNRCTEIAVKPLSEDDLYELLHYVVNEEEKDLHKEVAHKIIDSSDGSARKALVLLNAIIDLPSKKEQLEIIMSETAETAAIEIARALFNLKTNWNKMAKILSGLGGDEAEQIRWLVLSYAKSVLLKGGKLSGRAYIVITAFCDNFFDSKMAGLAAACWEVIEGEKD